MNQNSDRPGLLNDMRSSMNTALFLLEGLATSVEVFLHSGMGVRYPGPAGLLVLIVIPCHLLWFPLSDPRPLLWFMVAYFVVLLARRTKAQWRAKRGLNLEHSYYDGYPVLCCLFHKLSERTAKAFVEPLLVAFAGVVCTDWNAPLGWYLIFAAYGLRATTYFAVQAMRNQSLDMHDAMVSQRAAVQRFHNQNPR